MAPPPGRGAPEGSKAATCEVGLGGRAGMGAARSYEQKPPSGTPRGDHSLLWSWVGLLYVLV